MPRLALPSTLALAVVLTTSVAAPRPTHELRHTQSAASLAPAARHAPVSAPVSRARHTAVSSEAVFEALSWTPSGVRARLRAAAPGTYIDEMLAGQDSSLARWPSRPDAPLRVWVQPAPALPHWRPGLVRHVHEAFRAWEALDIPVRFTFVADSAAADVHVGWVERFREPISGKTVWARNDSWWIVGGDITIALRHSRGTPLDASAVRAIALHEVGHLLGLDHTADSTNIMAPRVRVRELSAADRATMRLLYELPAGRVR